MNSKYHGGLCCPKDLSAPGSGTTKEKEKSFWNRRPEPSTEENIDAKFKPKEITLLKRCSMPILLWSPWKCRCGQRTVRTGRCGMQPKSLRQSSAHARRSRSEKLKLEIVER
ncbi:hypothetical protein TNCV_4953821 [Trichonephila clavipes]|nr:hypothetical protein TNCV_4953821 [Trichonephila clavipes]